MKRGKLIALILAAGAVIAAAVIFDLPSLIMQGLDWISDLGWVGAIVYVLLYIALTVALIPGSIITLAGGFIFGLGYGTALVSLGSTVGASLAFLFGRFLFRNWVSRQMEGRPKFAAIDRAVAHEGWKIVFLTRLSPLFPFSLQNYAYGITGVRFLPYVLSSWIGMLPGTVMWVYFGSLAGNITEVAAGVSSDTIEQAGAAWLQTLINGLGLAATVAVTIFITRLARKALKKHMSSEDSPAGNDTDSQTDSRTHGESGEQP
ncbi:TVP38/TMEM64 family protein [Salinispira pacifica]|uniref:TVP38/TMEM64 family membrane protein n=1 Tax=Salinispira pacifica TaxID=1307761 RepID=V5WEC2_9SPIO|nr:TVP38/TMEM64 family protein [Salinispira pacifica]AHC13914.1 DedA family protein, putative [Salinispira pacifica]